MISLRALNTGFQLIKAIDYISLQWNRKYYSSGKFTVQIAADDFDSSMAYLYTPDRPEIGMIQQITVVHSVTGDYVLLSGFFLEFMLNDKIIYPVYNGSGKSEVVARALFSTYKEDLPMSLGTNHSRGSSVQFQETGGFLGDKIYELLQPDELSYRVNYDYVNETMNFEVWQGIDRTDSQSVNPRVVFSRDLGNVTTLTYTDDISNFKNYAVIGGEGEGPERVYTTLDLSGGGYKQKVFIDARDLRSDDLTTSEYTNALKQRGREKLQEYTEINDFDLDIDPTKKGREYLKDFDIGDKCDVNINLKGYSVRYSARVVEVEEVIKNNTWSVNITVGNKMPTDIIVAQR